MDSWPELERMLLPYIEQPPAPALVREAKRQVARQIIAAALDELRRRKVHTVSESQRAVKGT